MRLSSARANPVLLCRRSGSSQNLASLSSRSTWTGEVHRDPLHKRRSDMDQLAIQLASIGWSFTASFHAERLVLTAAAQPYLFMFRRDRSRAAGCLPLLGFPVLWPLAFPSPAKNEPFPMSFLV